MKTNQVASTSSTRFGPVKIGIVFLALATAIVHLVLLNYFMGTIDLLFTLNGLGFLALLGAYFLPQLKPMQGIVRWVFIIFTAITIIAWVIMGDRTLLGYITKLIEASLIALLLVDGRQS